jgi:hypothetical protein
MDLSGQGVGSTVQSPDRGQPRIGPEATERPLRVLTGRPALRGSESRRVGNPERVKVSIETPSGFFASRPRAGNPSGNRWSLPGAERTQDIWSIRPRLRRSRCFWPTLVAVLRWRSHSEGAPSQQCDERAEPGRRFRVREASDAPGRFRTRRQDQPAYFGHSEVALRPTPSRFAELPDRDSNDQVRSRRRGLLEGHQVGDDIVQLIL